jgi:hypothetical protein
MVFDFIGNEPILYSVSVKECCTMNKPTLLMIAAAVTLIGIGCEAPPRRRLPPPSPPLYRGQPMGLADIKMLAKSGVSDEVILSQIRNSHTVYRLSAAEILDLKDAGVSEKVIDFMINTPSLYRSSRPPPPPPTY